MRFSHKNQKPYIVIDVPGISKYRKNMLDGIQEANKIAVVVVEAGDMDETFSS